MIFVEILKLRNQTSLYAFFHLVQLFGDVLMQVWRPSGHLASSYNYTLIGQTFVRPYDLRFSEVTLNDHQMIDVKRGDVIGIQFADRNPLAWSSVPCGGMKTIDSDQHYLYFPLPATPSSKATFAVETNGALRVGKTWTFEPAPYNEPHPCRHYSLTAVMGQLCSIAS